MKPTYKIVLASAGIALILNLPFEPTLLYHIPSPKFIQPPQQVVVVQVATQLLHEVALKASVTLLLCSPSIT